MQEKSQPQEVLHHHTNEALSGICRSLAKMLSDAEEQVRRCKEQHTRDSTQDTQTDARATVDPSLKLQKLRPALETVRSRKRMSGIQNILEDLIPTISGQIDAAGAARVANENDTEGMDTILTNLQVRLGRVRETASGILQQMDAEERELKAEITQLTLYLTQSVGRPWEQPKDQSRTITKRAEHKSKRAKPKDAKNSAVAKTIESFLSKVTSGLNKVANDVTQTAMRTQHKVKEGISKVANDVKNKNKSMKMTSDLRRLVSVGALTQDQARQIMHSNSVSPLHQNRARKMTAKDGGDAVRATPSVTELLGTMTSKHDQKKYFLDIVAGGDVRCMSEFEDALSKQNHTQASVLRLFVHNDATERLQSDECPLFAAVCNGHLMAARWLVANGFAGGGGRANNPRLDAVYHPLGTTLVHVAAAAGFLHIVKWLHHTHGVSLEVLDTRGATPFLVASSTGNNSITDTSGANDVAVGEAAAFVLIQMGIDVERVDAQGCNCLHYAALGGQFTLLRRLWRRTNVSINAEDRHGRSTFQVACMTAAAADVEWFCNQLNERQVVAKDNYGRTALDIAAFFKNVEACKWLRENVESFNN